MTPFGPELDLNDLDGSNGITLNGIANGDGAGRSVSDAGDVNGDGITDFIIGAPAAAQGNLTLAGESYVVFGGATLLNSLDANGNLDLSTLDGSNGFVIAGKAANDDSGRSVSRAGDVNGDGVDDLIVGAPNAEPDLPNNDRGQSYVVFGIQGNRPSARIELASLDGTEGFAISGIDSQDQAGLSVSSLGDINGDGADELIVGAPFAELNPTVLSQGESYLILGRSDIGESGNLPLAAIGNGNSDNGFVIRGADFSERLGAAISSVGDVNNDGTPDFIIGAPNATANGSARAGKAYVIFGDAVVPNGVLDLANLPPSNGFVMEGLATNDRLGTSVSGIGDINGDTIDDFIVSAPTATANGQVVAGLSYVVFGGGGLNTIGNLDLSQLNGTNGFIIQGINGSDQAGAAVSGAGDINGDGMADLVVGAPNADPNGIPTGQAYVIFGSSTVGAANNGILNLANLDGNSGFTINGINSSDRLGEAVSNVGDVNLDNIDDLLVSAPGSFNGANPGQSYIVFGFNATNGDPTPVDDAIATDEDTAVTVNFLANDSDPENDALTVTNVVQPTNGSVTVNADNTLTYTPNANFNGAESFTYQVSDGNGGSASATVDVTVNPVNDAPVATDDTANTTVGNAVTLDVLGNDTDVDGDLLGVGTVGAATNGTVVLNADGTVTYTPDAGFTGTDSFTYEVTDGTLTDTATVNLTVDAANIAPIAQDDSVTTARDTDVTIDVLANDTDANGDPLSVSAVGEATNGTVMINADGTLTYTPDLDFTGNDSFTYEITDGNGGTSTATVAVTVDAVNRPPVANPDFDTYAEDSFTSITGDVLLNDTDPDGDAIAVVAVEGTPLGQEIPGQYGTFSMNANGLYGYTLDNANPAVDGLNAGETLTETFSYTISDGTLEDTTQLEITITGINDDQLAIAPLNADQPEGDSGSTPFTFEVNRTGPNLEREVRVDYTVTGTGAEAASAADFEGGSLPSGQIVLAPGATSQVISVDVVGEDLFEADETFAVTLSNASTNADIATATATGTIQNDDALVPTTLRVRAIDADRPEGNQIFTTFSFEIIRIGELRKVTNVEYAAQGVGPAPTDANDFFFPPSGLVTFQENEAIKVINLEIASDTLPELDETFELNLFNAANTDGSAVVIDLNGAEGIIRDDDQTTLNIIAENGSIAEGFEQAEFRITRTGNLNVETLVDVAVRGRGDNPVSPADFAGNQYPSQRVAFLPGEDSALFTFFTAQDTDPEPDETYEVVLSNPINAVLGDAIAAGTVFDDDTVISGYTISSGGSAINLPEGDAGTTNFEVLVRRQGDLSNASFVTLEITGSGANPADASDFDISTTTGVGFAPGEATQTLEIPVLGDTTLEADETFEVSITGTSDGLPILTPTIEFTIRNDDQAFAIAPLNADQPEGNTGTTPFTFTVTRTGVTENAATVDYTVQGAGTTVATEDDFGGTFPSGAIAFAPGETSQTLTLDVTADTALEGDDSFEVILSNAVDNAEITVDRATGIIRNDDVGGSKIAVTETTDDGTGQTLGTLSWAIQAANNRPGIDIIELKTDVRLNFADDRIRMEPLIDSDLTIEGNGFTISGDNNNNGQVDTGTEDLNGDGFLDERDADRPVFFVRSGNVTLQNLTVTGAVAQGGAGSGAGAGLGGALAIYDGAVMVANAEFVGNQAIGGTGQGEQAPEWPQPMATAEEQNLGGTIGLGNEQTQSTPAFFGKGGNGGDGGTGGFGAGGGAAGGGGTGDLSKGRNGADGLAGEFGVIGGNGTTGSSSKIGTGGTGGAGGFGGGGGVGGTGTDYRLSHGAGGVGGFGGGGGAPGNNDDGTTFIASSDLFSRGGFGGGNGFPINNQLSRQVSGGGGGAGMGGAIFIRSGTLDITDSSFTNNRAVGGVGSIPVSTNDDGQGFGGAIFAVTAHALSNHRGSDQDLPENLPTVTVNNTQFSGNTSQDPGFDAVANDVFGTPKVSGSNPIVTDAPGTANAASRTESVGISSFAAVNTDSARPEQAVALANTTVALPDNGIRYGAIALGNVLGIALTNEEQSLIKTAFGLPNGLNLNTFDPLAAASAGDATGAQVVAQLVATQTVIVQTGAALQGVLSDASASALETAAAGALVAFIESQVANGQTVDLDNPAQLQTLLTNVGSNLQAIDPTLDLQAFSDSQAALVQVISASTQAALDAPNQGSPVEAVQQLFQIQAVAQGDVATDLQAALAGQRPFSEVIAENTGTALDNQIAAADGNIAPRAAADEFVIARTATLTGNLLADNGNGADSDFDGDALTITAINGDETAVGQAISLFPGGSLLVEADGDFTYTPAASDDPLFDPIFLDEAGFTYTVSDGNGGTDTALVTIGLEEDDPVAPQPDLEIGLYDADTDALITLLEDGTALLASDLIGRDLNIVATVTDESPLFGQVESLFFDFNQGAITQTENIEPYALFGDRNGDLRGGSLPLDDNNTLSIDLFSEDRRRGDLLGTVTRDFTIVDDITGQIDLEIGLYDADTDALITLLADGGEILASDIAGRDLTIVAMLSDNSLLNGRVESLFFDLNQGTITQTENLEPYALFGDRNGDLRGGSLSLSENNTLSIDLFSEDRRQGDLLGTVTRDFTIVDDLS